MTYHEANVWRLNALVVSKTARIEAMKVANTLRQTQGQALAYHDDCFNEIANELENIAVEIYKQAECLPLSSGG